MLWPFFLSSSQLFLAELGFYLEGIVRKGGRREGREGRGRGLHSWEETTITLLRRLVKPQSLVPI